MSGTKQPKSDKKSQFVIGTSEPDGLVRRINRRKIALLASVVLLALLIGGLAYIANRSNLSPSQQAAITTADKKADGFDDKSTAYAATRLGAAMTFAREKKCPEANAVYEEVAEHQNGVSELDMSITKERIRKLCANEPL